MAHNFLCSSNELTQASLCFGNKYIWSHSLVLSVDQDPKPYLLLRHIEVVGNPALKGRVQLLFEDSEGRKFRSRPSLVFKRCQVEALVFGEGVVGDDLSRQIKMLLFALAFLRFRLPSFIFQPLLYVDSKSEKQRISPKRE